MIDSIIEPSLTVRQMDGQPVCWLVSQSVSGPVSNCVCVCVCVCVWVCVCMCVSVLPVSGVYCKVCTVPSDDRVSRRPVLE